MSVFAESSSALGRLVSSTRRMLESDVSGAGQRQPSNSVQERISAMYHRYYADVSNHSQACAHSTLASSQQTFSEMIKVVLSRLVDALIFTSAVAITAYNYWRGNLNSNQQAPLAPIAPPRQPVLDIKTLRQMHMYTHAELRERMHDHFDDSRRRRTQEWTETINQQQTQQEPRAKRLTFSQEPTCESTSSEQSLPKRRTQSLPPPPRPTDIVQESQKKQDEMFARMEERLQSLIQEGQAALTSEADLYEMDESEMAMRRAFSGKKYSY